MFILPFAFCLTASAWGPHGEITQAALDALGPDDALLKHLGTNAPKLVHYCWLGDYRRMPYERQGEFFYADDYLLFPGMERHLDHLVPEVKRTYEPFFRRALQALRTETPLNAARWIGSLLHFVEDTGSPPHSAEIRGDVHSKMENWVDAKLIRLPGYRPQLLGDTEEKALAGFLRRMDGLIAYSKERGDRCRPLVLADKRAEVEPIVLESALETSRVVADLLRTLGELFPKPPYKHNSIRGTVFSDGRPLRTTQGGPIRVLLLGTTHSTLADSNGDFVFTGLDEGDYKMVFMHPTLLAGITNVSTVREFDSLMPLPFLPAKLTSANLLRNPAFAVYWLAKNHPDAWYPTKTAWEGDLIPLKDGARYTLRLNWQAQPGPGDVVLRFRPNTHPGLPVVDTAPFKPGTAEHTFTGSDKMKWAQILIRTTNAPTTLLLSVALTPEP
ncbi:MAG: hypothetical protein ACKODH_12525 [Limisphaerales bacterium]